MADEPQTLPTPDPVAAAPEPTPPTPPDPYADRFDRLERQYTQVLSQLSQMAQAQLTPPQSELKDEELWALGQQGNRQAFEMYMERIAQRTSGSRIGQYQQEQMIQGQLAALYGKYPELSNPNHPVTQRAVQFKAALLRMGSPNTLQTDLDAILRAVADSREVFAPKITPAARTPEPTSGQIGVAHQQPSTPVATSPVSAEDAVLAKKFGIKDPAKALEKFWARNADGRSAVSPLIASALEREQK